MKKSKTLISIITVVYNGEKFLEETIKSVINQTYSNVEHIIIDGASTDKTIEIIKKYEDNIAYWVSEKDDGIYDAMNKGLKAASGEYIVILNADDYLENDALSVSKERIIDTKSDYSYANARYLRKDDTTIIRPINPLDEQVYFQMPYPHVSLLIKASIYQELGYFDTSFKIAADHDFAAKVYVAGYKGIYLEQVVCNLHEGGISGSFDANLESLKVARKYKNIFICYYELAIQFIKYSMVQILPRKLLRTIMKLKNSRHV